MKSPLQFDESMLAPCGMNCTVCYMHAAPRKYGKACIGCFGGDANKPQHCRKCAIRQCAFEKGLTQCHLCEDMPCRLIKNLDKSYRKRYRVSLIENMEAIRKNGVSRFLENERGRWTCLQCDGLVSLHDGVCSDCGEAHLPQE